jgi:hypothetical protein
MLRSRTWKRYGEAGFAAGIITLAATLVSHGAFAGEISGLLIAADTGMPLSGIPVTAQDSAGEVRKSFTGADGRFSFVDLPSGSYTLVAADQSYRSAENGSRVYLTAEQKLNVTLRALQPASIAGRVFNESGPFPGAEVRLYARQMDGMRGLLRRVGTATTGRNGHFRFGGLMAGVYVLETDSAPASEPLSVDWGTAAVAGDFWFNDSQSAAVSGVAIMAETGQPCRCRIEIAPALRAEPKRSATINGTFSFGKLLPGTYWLSAHSIDAADQGATMEFLMTGRDLIGTSIRVTPGATVSGEVRFDDEQPGRTLRDLSVRLSPLSGPAEWPSRRSEVAAENSFHFERVLSGRYRVELDGLPENAYLKGIRFGQRDLMRPETDIPEEGDFRLDIILGTDGGKVHGHLPAPHPDVTILLVPADTASYSVNRSAIADEAGVFEIAGIPPGSYVLYALEGQIASDPLDPEARAHLVRHGLALSIGRNEVVPVDLDGTFLPD